MNNFLKKFAFLECISGVIEEEHNFYGKYQK